MRLYIRSEHAQHISQPLFVCRSAVIAAVAVSSSINVYRITKPQKGGVAKLVDAPVEFPKVSINTIRSQHFF